MKKEIHIKKELTPKSMTCGWGMCPAIFETDNNSYLLVGKKVNAKKLGILNRVNKEEVLIEVPKNLIDKKQ